MVSRLGQDLGYDCVSSWSLLTFYFLWHFLYEVDSNRDIEQMPANCGKYCSNSLI